MRESAVAAFLIFAYCTAQRQRLSSLRCFQAVDLQILSLDNKQQLNPLDQNFCPIINSLFIVTFRKYGHDVHYEYHFSGEVL